MTHVGIPYKQFDAGERFDAIVIGSGVGGLTTAALLAKHAGRRVLVLERHYTAGGFTHVFRRPGYEWDVGVHYIGDVLSEETLTRRLFDHVTEGRLKWASMGEVYDRVVVGEDSYEFVAGRDAFLARMQRDFPEEAQALERYVALVRRVARRSGRFFASKALPAPLEGLLGPLLRRGFLRHARRTTADVLAELTPNRRLRTVLAGQFGDYGLPPGRSSFGVHALVARHYLWGAAFPIGGAAAIAAGIAPLIEHHGGRIVVGAEVEQIRVEQGRATGVRLAGGRELAAPLVVSDAGLWNTYHRLLPADCVERLALADAADAVPRSAAHVCLYLGFNGTAEELGLPRANLWVYPGDDQDAAWRAAEEDAEAPLPVVFISFPSAKDPTFQERCPGRATVELVTFAPYRHFARWEDGAWRRRGPDYDALKARYSERLLDVLDRHLPHLRGRIDFSELSTPLSTRHFTAYERGEIYGLDHSPARFAQRHLRPRTPVRGLYLCGQDVVTCGVAGAMAGGVLSASAILGRNLIRKVGKS